VPYLKLNDECGQSLTTNALQHLIDQSEKRILQTDQSKNTSKHLQHHIDRTISH